jgi:hypothetical protein
VRRGRRLLAACALLGVLLLALMSARGRAAPACTINWDGGGGTFSWHTAANWDTNVVPGASDHVCIPAQASAVVYSTGTTSILSLQATGPVSLTGGILNLTDAGNASNVGTFSQSGGTLGGAGALNVATAYNWSAGTMTDGGTTTVAGAATLTQTGFTTLGSTRVVENAGIYDFTADVAVNIASGATPVIHNTGTMRKSAGANTASIFAPLENDGTVVSNSGTLILRAGSGTSTGTFGGAAATGTVEFDAGTYAVSGATFPGHAKLAGGTLNVADSSTLTMSGGNSMTAGTIGGNGTLSLTAGTLTWSGGTMGDAGTTSVAGGATISQTGFTTLASTRLVENAGTYDFAADVAVNVASGGTPTIHNSGTISKSAGVNTGSIFAALDNDGVVVSNSGTLILRAGTGTGTGTFGGAAATGTVEFDAGTYTLAGATFPGHTKFAGATLNAADASTVTVSGANAMSAGVLGGNGTFSLTGGTFAWTGGSMSDAGTTSVAAGATLSQGGFTSLGGTRLVENAGTWDFTADVAVNILSGATPTIHNTGAIGKSGGVNTASIFAALDNDGSVVASSGTLILRAAAGTGTGSFGGAAATGTVEFDAGTFLLAGASMPGHVKFAGATLQAANGATVTVSGANAMSAGTLGGGGTFSLTGGTLTWSGGTMADGGTTAVASGATLAQTGFTTLGGTRLVDNAGTWDFGGDFAVNVASGATPTIHNAVTGAIGKSAGVNTATIFAALDNDGSVAASSGTLALRAGVGTGSGSFGGAAAGGTVSFSAGTFTLAGASLLGKTTLVGATLTVPAAGMLTSSGTNTVTAGTVGGPGSFTVASGTLNWNGGTMTDAGTTTVAAGATLVQDGTMTLAAGRVLENAGTWQFAGDRIVIEGAAPAPTIHNTGTVTKTGGTGEAQISVGFSNAGTVTSTSGRVSLFKSAPGAQGGTFTGVSDTAHAKLGGGTFTLGSAVALQGTVELGGANVTVPDGETLAVPSRLLITSGEIRGPGTVNVTGTLAWNGGTQRGPGTTVVAPTGKIDADPGFCDVDLADGRVIENHGTITFLHHTSLSSFGTARSEIDNDHAIVLDDTPGTCTGDADLGGDVLVVNNAGGTITKSGGAANPSTNVTRIDGTIDNDGLVDAHAGDLELTSTSAVTQTGAFASSGGAGSALGFEDGVFRMGAGASIAGGTAFDGAEVDVVDGAVLSVLAGDTLSMPSGTVGGDGTLRIVGVLNWTGGKHVGDGSTVVEPGGSAIFAGTGTSIGLDEGRVFVNRGSIVWPSGDFFAGDGTSLVNAGTLEMQGTSSFGGSGFFGFGSGSMFHNAGLFKKTGATTASLWVPVDNDGTIEVDGGRVDFQSALLNYSAPAKRLTAGTFVVHGATLGLPANVASNASELLLDGPASQLVYVSGLPQTQHDAFDVLAANLGAGNLTLDNGRSVTTPGPFRNAGVVTLAASSQLTTTGAFTQTGGITNLAGATSRLTATGATAEVKAGRFGGIGSVGPTLTATGGEVQPGLDATGVLHADAFTAGAGSTLRIQLDGTTPGSGFDQLAVVGAASLGGALAIDTAPAFHPTLGSTFQIATFGSRTGTFASVSGLSLGGGLAYSVVYDATDVTLTVVAGPDAVVPPVDAAPPPNAGPRTDNPATYDDKAFVASGAWARGATYSVSSLRGSTLLLPGLTAHRLTLRARSCRRCGIVALLWNRRLLRRIDLGRDGAARRRSYLVASFAAPRTGTLMLRVVSRGRPVAIDAVVGR